MLQHTHKYSRTPRANTRTRQRFGPDPSKRASGETWITVLRSDFHVVRASSRAIAGTSPRFTFLQLLYGVFTQLLFLRGVLRLDIRVEQVPCAVPEGS